MGLVALKHEFEILSDLRGTAENARYFLRKINLSPYGYDFRTIASWSNVVNIIRERLYEIKQSKKAEQEAEAKAKANSELQKESIKVKPRIVRFIHKVNYLINVDRARRKLLLWSYLNKNKPANKYIDWFIFIINIVKRKLVNT